VGELVVGCIKGSRAMLQVCRVENFMFVRGDGVDLVA